MTERVVKLEVVSAGESLVVPIDDVLDGAKDKGIVAIAILGQLEDGTHYVAGNLSEGRTLMLMERCKLELLGLFD